MVDDFLTQAEVESLLAAMDGDGGTTGEPGDGEVSGQLARSGNKASPCKIKRPERVGKEQMLSLIHI